MKSSVWAGMKAVFLKELLTGFRFKASWSAMLMFAFTTMAGVSLSLYGATPEPNLQAALIWLVIFFSATTALDRLFIDEEMGGTLSMLRVYAPAQAVFFGKLLYALLLVFALAFFTLSLFFVLLDISTHSPFVFFATILLGVCGLAGAGTFVSALTVSAGMQSALASVLLLPVILPVFLPAIFLTSQTLAGAQASLVYLGGIALYDTLIIVGASLLFDYMWYEE